MPHYSPGMGVRGFPLTSALHVSTFVLKYNRLSHDVVGSNVDRVFRLHTTILLAYYLPNLHHNKLSFSI